ncbi:MAG: CPBP family intramembrane glutamic endopeptidase [Candidatus Methylomirabilales bacterium]
MSQVSYFPTIVGLCIALGGAVLPVSKLLSNPDSFTARMLEQGFLWVLFGLVIAIVILWEKQSLSSIGFRPQWKSVAWGSLLVAVMIFVTGPLGIWVLKQSGLPGFESGFTRLANLPVWFLAVAVVTAGVVEETLYRGYAIERLALFTGNYWWAGLLALTAFALVHVPFWGWGPVLVVSISGIPLLVFYIWKRDLLACIIAHTVMDTVGFQGFQGSGIPGTPYLMRFS